MSWVVGIGSWVMGPGSWVLAFGLLYSLLIGFFTRGWFNVRGSAVSSQQPAVGSQQSAVSIVVAVRNEKKNVSALLQDLLLQDYLKELTEIIIVDDHSSDGTPSVVTEFIGRNLPLRIKLIKTADFRLSGKKAAINLGIEHAAGEIILTTDADCRVRPEWISTMVHSFVNERITMVIGPVSYFEGNGFWDDFQSVEFAGLVASGAGAALAGHPFMCNGANLSYRKDAFLKVSGFEGNEKFLSGDDVFLLHKLKKEFGRKSISFCKDEKAIVKTYPAAGFGKFLAQRIRWASKSKGYKDPLSIITAIIIFSYSLIVLTAFLAGFSETRYFLLFGGFLVWKMITDLPLMIGITQFSGQRRLMRWYLPFQLIYPVYIVIAGFLSLFRRKKW